MSGPNVTGFWASFSLSSDPPFLQLHLHGFVLLTYLVLGGDSPRPPPSPPRPRSPLARSWHELEREPHGKPYQLMGMKTSQLGVSGYERKLENEGETDSFTVHIR